MHILVVDDHQLFRSGLIQLLQGLSRIRKISEAESIAEARRLIRENGNFGLILLDYELPDGKGINLLMEIKRQYPEQKVAMLSAWEDIELMRRSLEIGALGYIPKSTRATILLTAIQLMLEGGTYIPPHLLSLIRDEPIEEPMSSSKHLTERQLEVLKLIRSGMTNKEIARLLGISEATVKAHVTAILRYKGVSSRNKLLLWRKRTKKRKRSRS